MRVKLNIDTHMKKISRAQKKLTIGMHNALFQGVRSANGGFRLRFLVLDSKLKETECICTLKIYSNSEIKKLFNGDHTKCLNKHFEIKLSKNTYNDLLTITMCKPKRFDIPSWYVSYSEEWQGSRNGEKPSEIKKEYLKSREAKDPFFKRTNTLRDLQNKGIAGDLPMDRYENLFGIDYKGLRAHIESTFQKGFTWSNRGKVWHLDHKVPLTAFNLFDKAEMKMALHYSNLQALTKRDNLKKYNKIPEIEKKPLTMAERIELHYAEEQNMVDKED